MTRPVDGGLGRADFPVATVGADFKFAVPVGIDEAVFADDLGRATCLGEAGGRNFEGAEDGADGTVFEGEDEVAGRVDCVVRIEGTDFSEDFGDFLSGEPAKLIDVMYAVAHEHADVFFAELPSGRGLHAIGNDLHVADVVHLAEFAAVDDGFHLGIANALTLGVGDVATELIGCTGVEDRVAFRGGAGHGLVDKYMLARLRGHEALDAVEGVGCGDADEIDVVPRHEGGTGVFMFDAVFAGEFGGATPLRDRDECSVVDLGRDGFGIGLPHKTCADDAYAECVFACCAHIVEFLCAVG